MKNIDKINKSISNYSDLVDKAISLNNKKILTHKYNQRLRRSFIIYYTKKIEINLRLIFNIQEYQKLTIIDIYKLILDLFNDTNYIKKLEDIEDNSINRFQLRRKIHNILIKEINNNLLINNLTNKKNLSKIKLLKALDDYLNFTISI